MYAFCLKDQLAAGEKQPGLAGGRASEVPNRFSDEISKDHPLNLEDGVGYLGSRQEAPSGDAFWQGPARGISAGVERAEDVAHVRVGPIGAISIIGPYHCSAWLLPLVRRLICSSYRINVTNFSTRYDRLHQKFQLYYLFCILRNRFHAKQRGEIIHCIF